MMMQAPCYKNSFKKITLSWSLHISITSLHYAPTTLTDFHYSNQQPNLPFRQEPSLAYTHTQTADQISTQFTCYTVLWHCWLGGRKGIRPVKKQSGGVLVWLSVWSKVQTTLCSTRYFLFQIISFKKYFNVSLGNNFLLFFSGGPLVVEALGNCPVCPPPLNPALVVNLVLSTSVASLSHWASPPLPPCTVRWASHSASRGFVCSSGDLSADRSSDLFDRISERIH